MKIFTCKCLLQFIFAQPVTVVEWQPEQKMKFGLSWKSSTKLCIERQAKLIGRNTKLWRAQIGQSIILGLIVGSLYFQIGIEQYTNRFFFSLFFFIFFFFYGPKKIDFLSPPQLSSSTYLCSCLLFFLFYVFEFLDTVYFS